MEKMKGQGLGSIHRFLVGFCTKEREADEGELAGVCFGEVLHRTPQRSLLLSPEYSVMTS